MFADNLKTLRRARGLSQEELAGRLHVTRQTISKWENALSVPNAELLLRLAEELEVEVGKTTKDGKFTLNATRCLGACGLAPVMMIGEEVYGKLTPESVKDVLDKYRKEENA